MRGTGEENPPTIITITHQGIPVKLSNRAYEPGEDTYLLLKACLNHIIEGESVLEIGAGCGIISAILQHRKNNLHILATDINPYAVACIKANNVPVIRADLLRGIKARFHTIIFNPPYLPTSREEQLPGWLNHAFDGGPTGTDVLFRFLEQAPQHLTPNGKILTIISSLTDTERVQNKMLHLGYTVEEIEREKHFFEELIVLKATPDRPK